MTENMVAAVIQHSPTAERDEAIVREAGYVLAIAAAWSRRYPFLDRDDIAAETTCLVLRTYHRWDPAACTLRAWLRWRVRAAVARMVRKTRLERTVGDEKSARELFAGVPAPAHGLAESAADVVAVLGALDRITPNQRAVIVAVYGLDGQPPRSYAEACPGLPHSSVASRLASGLAAIRRLLVLDPAASQDVAVPDAPPVKRPDCRHCRVRPVCRTRGLCAACFNTPQVRELYPPTPTGQRLAVAGLGARKNRKVNAGLTRKWKETPPCRHCQILAANKGKGLCYKCYGDLEIRGLYPRKQRTDQGRDDSATPPCRHCTVRRGNSGRGLCNPCYGDRSVRALYPFLPNPMRVRRGQAGPPTSAEPPATATAQETTNVSD